MPRTPSTPRIAYEVHGSAGTPVLLIMGYGMCGRVWSAQVDALREHHRVVTFDHRGVGDSESSSGWWSMADMAMDANRVLDGLAWDDVHVVGVSMGGMVAQEFALRHAGRTRSLTLIATHAGGPLAWVPPPRGVPAFLRALSRNPDRRARGMQALLYPPEFVEEVGQATVDGWLRQRVEPTAPRRTLLRQFRALARHRTRSRLGTVSVPTLVVRPGADNLIASRHNDVLVESIPGAVLYCLDSAGHGVIQQEAERLNSRLLDHFASTDSLGENRP